MDTEYVAPLADPGTVEPAAPSTATDSPAPVSPEAYYRRRFAHATHDELVAEIIRLHRGYGTELADTERELCQALGMVEDLPGRRRAAAVVRLPAAVGRCLRPITGVRRVVEAGAGD